MHILAKVSIKLGGYGCGFVNGCGLVTRNTKYHLKSASSSNKPLTFLFQFFALIKVENMLKNVKKIYCELPY